MRHLLLCLFVLTTLFSCREDEKIHILYSPERIAFDFVGGSGKIAISSDIEWSATASVDWIKIDSTTSRVIYFQLTANRTKATRTAYITISASTEQHQVLIEQTAPSTQPERAFDSIALADLFKQCNGQKWRFGVDTTARPWKLGTPITEWEGVGTNIIEGQLRVTSLNLSGSGLEGRLPATLTDLTKLQVLMLRQNNIEGDVISLCAKFPDLIYLDLARNEFINFKDVPPAGSFGKLQFLDLSVCPIHDKIPTWAMLPQLSEFLIASSNITGEIPQEIASMTSLTKLDLSDNKLSGTIPQWITSLTMLSYLDLATCRLSGGIPSDIGKLNQLTLFKLAYNNLSGPIPVGIAQISNLNTLNLSGNSFTNFPDEIIKSCDKLNYIDISFNNIEGRLIKEWAALADLQEFTVLGNRLSGSIPSEIWNHDRWAKTWFGESLIYPQQEGYGFSNELPKKRKQ